MTAVLFLDAEMRPLRVEPWQTAIADLFLGKVEMVEYSRDRTIRGVSQEYPMPLVVRVLRTFKRDRIRIKFSRLNIYARDQFRCQYCRIKGMTEDLTFDHVVPRSQGGRTTWENIVTCCVPCNAGKADRMLHDTRVHHIPELVFCTRGGGCPWCAKAKKDVIPELAATTLKLRKMPWKPTYLPAISVKMDSRDVPAAWRPYWEQSLEE